MLNTGRAIRDIIIQVVDWFHKPFQKWIPQETFRYAATGGANTAFDIFLYFLVYNFLFDQEVVHFGPFAFEGYIAAFILVFPITFCTGFILAKYVTFTQSDLRGRKQLFRYAVSVAGSILLNYVLLKLFVEVFGLWATVAKMITTVIVVTYSYLTQRYYSFKTGKIFSKLRSR